MYAKVLTEVGVSSTDKLFTYHVPKQLENVIKVGIRVIIPFGNRTLYGFVIEITNNNEYDNSKIKDIISLVDEEVVLNDELMKLGKYLSTNLLCSMISSYQVMLPKALKAKINNEVKIKYQKYLTKNKTNEEIDSYINNCKYESQKELLCKLKEEDILITKMTSQINTILKHDLAKIIYEEVGRFSYKGSTNYKKVVLNEMQQKVSDEVSSSFNKSNTFLLYGVTGSGKTEVYLDIIEKALNNGKTAIMLVPEISLTPQIVGKFISRFSSVAVLHSALSDAERYDEYRRISSGKVKIVIGTRSAIFAPLTNIGVIILDEEHTSSYKQENMPSYSAKDVAIWRSKYHNCPVVLGSATPSLESFSRGLKGVYHLLTLTKRANDNSLPKANIISMKEEIKSGYYPISKELKEKITDRLNKNEQVILLLNKRGYSSVITCPECGYTFKCPKCDITYTYHKTSNNLKCHYCGYSVVMPKLCPECGSNELRDTGYGTEYLEEKIKKEFNARVIRMDVDTTSRKNSHQKIIDAFANHEYDILIGTQMVAKGLDFPLVTLVGIVSADSSLNAPDFRASENTFNLLEQVSGRAGRGERKGEVVIQTFNPDHYSIKLSCTHDYIKFFNEEMKIRKMLSYPPYYYLTLITLKTSIYELGFTEGNKIRTYLKNKLDSSVIVLGPTMANMFKVNNVYHYQIILKYKKCDNLNEVLKYILSIYNDNNKISVNITFDPIRV